MTRRKKKDAPGTFLDAYRRIRKPMPPPERVVADRRRRMRDEDARREIEQATREDATGEEGTRRGDRPDD